MRILCGCLGATSGKALVGDLDVLERPREVKQRIGYLPEVPPLYGTMTVRDYVTFAARIKGVSDANGAALKAIDRTGLTSVRGRIIDHLSKGYRQRVGLAQALVHDPEVLVLDEPNSGLDPAQRVEIRDLLTELAAGDRTVILSTHVLGEVEALCDRAIILMNGEIKADAHLSELAATSDAILVLEKAHTGVDRALRNLRGVRGVERTQTPDGHPAYRVLGKSTDGVDLCPMIYDLARKEDWPLRELRRDVRTLETVFNELHKETGLLSLRLQKSRVSGEAGQ